MVQAAVDETQRRETLGPAERIIQALTTHTDHLYHGRPGMVTPDARHNIGVRWEPVTHKVNEDGTKTVQKLVMVGKKTTKVDVGTLQADNSITGPNGQRIAEYRPAGIFPEVATWMYRQVADVWSLDNEFAAKWASYAFNQDHRDLKVILAAFMLVQSRKGDPVLDGGKVIFNDDDFRDVGEAMFLIYGKGNQSLGPKELLRTHELLNLPQVADINRELGFGRSTRKPFLGRWTKAVQRWLTYRENNIQLLEGAVKGAHRQNIMKLARLSGYKPVAPKFFQTLRWKQVQAKDGRRTLAIGDEVATAEDWSKLTEMQICEKIMAEKLGYKRIVGLVPSGITRAILAAAVEAGSLSDKDLIIQTPTLEELGLLKVQEVKAKWDRAVSKAEDMRASNIATRVKGKEAREQLQGASDNALRKALAEDMKSLEIYIFVDTSSSMDLAIQEAIDYVSTIAPGFPLEHLHVATFNVRGQEVVIKHPSKAGVQQAFKGISAAGGTLYSAAMQPLAHYKPGPDRDAIFIFVGDEACARPHQFAHAVIATGINPVALGLIKVVAPGWVPGNVVQQGAIQLGIPCLHLDNKMFDDPYAVTRILRDLIASTPVGAAVAARRVATRVTLVDTILNHELLKKPVWAVAA